MNKTKKAQARKAFALEAISRSRHKMNGLYPHEWHQLVINKFNKRYKEYNTVNSKLLSFDELEMLRTRGVKVDDIVMDMIHLGRYSNI